MLFTSATFLVFFSVVFTGYYAVPKGFQWAWLLLASYAFYAAASPVFALFLLFSTAVTYLSALWLIRIPAGQAGRRKAVLALDAALTLGLLATLKYSSFFLGTAAGVAGLFGLNLRFSGLSLLLPVGLSFYTFQCLGYCIDVYRDSCPPERNFFRFALFVSYFPQILQGPIGNFADLSPQLSAQRGFSARAAASGARRAAWGFFKKLVIADQLAVIAAEVFGKYERYAGFTVAFALLCYSIQLYADFSGYMDIALGCSEMLGIRLAENFDLPYFSKSVAEFWKRWHITLGAWFRNYLFYPLLRSAVFTRMRDSLKKRSPRLLKTLPNAAALLIVWLLIGLWHGANWNYILYGLYHGVFIILAVFLAPAYRRAEKRLAAGRAKRLYAFFQYARTFLIVAFGYLLFRSADLHVAGVLLRNLLGGFSLRSLFLLCYNNIRELAIAFIGVCLLFSVELYHLGGRRAPLRERISKLRPGFRFALYVCFILSILVLGAYGTRASNEFAYFRF